MSCSSCHLDIRGSTYIKCMECIIPSMQFCLPCFTGSYETDRHKSSHDYCVISPESELVVKICGCAISEILMLMDCARKFSVGSWAQMRSRTNIEFTAATEEIFMCFYLKWLNVCGMRSSERLPSLSWGALVGAHLPDSAGLSANPITDCVDTADLPGFMSKRVDFDIEYDDSAELIIADIEFGADDTNEDVAIKLKSLHAFNDRIRRREEVKKFAVEHRLVSAQTEMAHHRCRTAEEVELRGKLRPIERHFSTVEDFESFVQLLLAEARVMTRINKLKKSEDVKMEEGCVDISSKDSKPVTRSKSYMEGSTRKGKTADEECARLEEMLAREPPIFAPIEDSTTPEGVAMSKLGLDNFSSFTAIRDVLLDNIARSGVKSSETDLTITRIGDVLTFKTETLVENPIAMDI